MTDDFKNKYKTISSLIREHRLAEALRQLLSLTQTTGMREIAEKTRKLQADYDLLLKYFIDGIKDPQRDKLYRKLVEQTYTLLDKLHRNNSRIDSPNLYFNTFRFEALRPEETVANLIREYFKAVSDSSLFNILADDSAGLTSQTADRDKREKLERRIFTRLWVTYPLKGENLDAVSNFLNSEEIPVYAKQLIISSLLLGLLEYFDENRLSLLLDVYNGNPESPLAVVALTGIILCLFKHSNRPLTDKIILKLEKAAELPTWRNDLRLVYQEIVRTRDNERINKKMTDEVIPGLLNLRPDIAKLHLDPTQLTDIDEIEENPEWMDLLEKSGVADKIKEMSEIQEQGGDVFMSTFAHLKTFPFFSEIANWFMPFHSSHSLVVDSDDSTGAIADLMIASPFLCNSDKFSFFLSVRSVPDSQRKMMMSQFKNYNVNLAELRAGALNSNSDNRKNQINKYIQDIYRFFKLFRRHDEFNNPFEQRLNILAIPVLAQWFDNDETPMAVAEFYFSHKYYGEALDMFKSIEQLIPPTSAIYQKIGFCLQRGGEIENALEYYQRAELLDSRSLWNLKRIAACLMIMTRFREAHEYYHRIVEQNPDNIAALIGEADCLVELSRYEEALPILHKIIYLSPENLHARRSLARCQFMTGDLKGAGKTRKRLIETDPNYMDYLNLGHIYFSRKDYKEALNFYRLASESAGEPIENTIGRIRRDIPDMQHAGIDVSSLDFLIDALN